MTPNHPVSPPRDAALPAVTTSQVAVGAALSAGALTVLAHVLNPDLDPSWTPISDYALGTDGWAMTAGFVAWSLSLLTAAGRLWPRIRSRLARTGLALVIVGGLGPLVAAAFPADPVTGPASAASTTGMLHAVGAVMGDGVPLGALLLLFALRRSRSVGLAPAPSLVLATAATWVGAIWVGVALATYAGDGVLGPDTPIGWANRAMVAAYLGYAVVLGRLGGRSRE